MAYGRQETNPRPGWQQKACVCFGIALLLALAAPAQNRPGTGAVAGTVFCSDTQRPARFALISLVPDVTAASSSEGRRFFGGTSASTAADGTFIIRDVSPGEYDVQVVMPGYIQPVRQLNYFSEDDPERQVFISMLTKVTVAANQTVSVTVTTYRGADMAGTVSYDDGSPAAGVTVSALFSVPQAGATASSTGTAPQLQPVGASAQTDDYGHFHIWGLADGNYSLQALPRGGGLFPVYLGNTYDRTKATLVPAKSGEERGGLDLVMNLGDLHHVRGTLTSPENRPLPGARVTLAIASSPGATVSVQTGDDGSFTLPAVPDGTYTLSVAGAYDPDTHTIYKGVSTQVTVAGIDINDANMAATQ